MRRSAAVTASRSKIGALTGAVLLLVGCGVGDPGNGAEAGSESASPGRSESEATPAPAGGGPARETVAAGGAPALAGVEATAEDWRILDRTVRWAEAEGVDTLPVGEAVARVGLTFVGTPYVPRTLEVPGPERLVVNLRALDCVTLVETALAVVHTLHELHALRPERGRGSPSRWTDQELRSTYADALRQIRYRNGRVDGYPSRLHYFSEWIRDAEQKGIVRDVTAELGGIADPEAVTFMGTHPEAYRQLADTAVLREIRRTEERLSRIPRTYVPEGRIAEVAPGIRTGDVIAATSTVEGLDIAHTGIALWREGSLHLLHAPLVGDSVQVSPESLARRIVGISGQDGIMVARPIE